MLDKCLNEADEQHQLAQRNHLIHLSHLMQLQDSRLKGLQEEFERDLGILVSEFDLEHADMQKNQRNKVKELEDMIYTVKEEDKKKEEEAKQE